MGWCGATTIFDVVCEAVLNDKEINKEALIEVLAVELEDGDWDCHSESEYWEHPVVRNVMEKLHPSWFEDEN